VRRRAISSNAASWWRRAEARLCWLADDPFPAQNLLGRLAGARTRANSRARFKL